MRLGYVVGNAGLGKALIIIGLANAISVLTSISLSAIATNLKVKVGGPYYIIKDPDKSIVSGVLAAEDIDLDAEPEEGKQAEVAAALDALADTEANGALLWLLQSRETRDGAGQAQKERAGRADTFNPGTRWLIRGIQTKLGPFDTKDLRSGPLDVPEMLRKDESNQCDRG